MEPILLKAKTVDLFSASIIKLYNKDVLTVSIDFLLAIHRKRRSRSLTRLEDGLQLSHSIIPADFHVLVLKKSSFIARPTAKANSRWDCWICGFDRKSSRSALSNQNLINFDLSGDTRISLYLGSCRIRRIAEAESSSFCLIAAAMTEAKSAIIDFHF